MKRPGKSCGFVTKTIDLVLRSDTRHHHPCEMSPESVSLPAAPFQCEIQSDPLYHRVCKNRRKLERQAFDRAYLLRLIQGDPETEREFTRYFGALLTIKLRARLHSSQAVEDLRQETFVRVLKNLREKGLEHPESLGSYVNSVCEFVMLEHFRSSARYQQIPENAPETPDRRASPEFEFITEERKKIVRNVLDTLPAAERSLLRAVFLEERNKDQICAELRITRDYLWPE
jgi:RNA polymerase sigma-70 factor, ECF subfamily